mgnify:FL=1
MAKKLIEGKTKKSKSKSMSHRPVRQKNVFWDKGLNKWFKISLNEEEK